MAGRLYAHRTVSQRGRDDVLEVYAPECTWCDRAHMGNNPRRPCGMSHDASLPDVSKEGPRSLGEASEGMWVPAAEPHWPSAEEGSVGE